MKTKWLLYYFILIMPGVVVSCTSGQNKQQQATDTDIYTCAMHPQVLLHKPGNCPICGMQLIKKNTAAVAINDIPLETLLKPTGGFVVASLPVTTPQQKS